MTTEAAAAEPLNEPPAATDPATPFALAAELPTRGAGSAGQELAAYRWSPAAPTGAVAADDGAPLVIVHGFAEHARRHSELATAAAAAGHPVYALDLPGHGRSPGRRAMVDGYGRPLAAVSALLEHVAAVEAGRLPILLGHSMGGAIALGFALDHPQRLAGLVLSSPFLIDGVTRPAWMLALLGVVAKLLPGFPVTKLDSRLISRDRAEVARYVGDPLNYTAWLPAVSGHTLTNMGAELLQRSGRLSVPTLVIHGESDGIASVEGSRALQAAAPAGLVDLLTIPDGPHELFHDAERTGVPQRVAAAVLDYLAGR